MVKKMSELSLIDIPWETRNLSMPAFQLEGTIINHKVVESILEKKQIELKESFFVQLKLDAEKINEVLYAQEGRLRLMEMSISPYLNLKNVRSQDIIDSSKSIFFSEPSIRPNIENHYCSVNNLHESVKKEIIDISKETFSDDRFHMDPNCKKSVADERIRLWVELDILKDDKNFCSYIKINESLVGYILWNQKGFILGGLSKDFIGKGFGKTLYNQSILDVMDKGFQDISTNISVNNVPVLNLYSKLGFSFREPKYILHYWFLD